MSGFQDDTGFRALSEVEAYWHGLRTLPDNGGGVPKRSDIDPRGIENALEFAFILEKIAPGLARLRIAGMHLSDLMGMEVRGMPISSFLPSAARSGFSEMFEDMLTRPALAKLKLSAETGIGKPPLEGRMILCPLRNDFGDISRVLGCFETRGPIGRAPRRFNLLETTLVPVADMVKNSHRFARSEEQPNLDPALRDPGARFRHRGGDDEKAPQRPSYLRLVKSDE
ncbi:PAS domain-containing protein [Alisedimentitalea sp. MJ-SS2]|uniref:PAS domain-containing protein n=1 Tax=Aliisedimentitalea sp. MJ-SS2 TaxID=3049795 RepID=UPI0029107879|nr:PAS domain-containing protein [Alisedimentitalea sp. MJ-SS2]MDU8926920.1 PAS domain-containing protein [Alisedimentitalea sp. MJ-SS2]